jgi:hypothetical protein
VPKVPTCSCHPTSGPRRTGRRLAGQMEVAFGPRICVGLRRMIGQRAEISKHAYRRRSLGSCWLGGTILSKLPCGSKNIGSSLAWSTQVRQTGKSASVSPRNEGCLFFCPQPGPPVVKKTFRWCRVPGRPYKDPRTPEKSCCCCWFRWKAFTSHSSIAPDTRWPAKPTRLTVHLFWN